jgi:hypothetical protein
VVAARCGTWPWSGCGTYGACAAPLVVVGGHGLATSRTKGDVVCIRRSSVGNISLVASKSVRLDLVNSSSSLFSAFLRFHLR